MRKNLTTSNSLPAVIKDFDMPIKGGQKLRCSIVNPLVLFEEPEKRQEVIATYLSSFNNDRIDILLKKQNTMDYLTIANECCDRFFSKNPDFERLGRMLGIESKEAT